MFKKIIVLLVLITSIVLSQGWNDIKPTNISLANANYAEMFRTVLATMLFFKI